MAPEAFSGPCLLSALVGLLICWRRFLDHEMAAIRSHGRLAGLAVLLCAGSALSDPMALRVRRRLLATTMGDATSALSDPMALRVRRRLLAT